MNFFLIELFSDLLLIFQFFPVDFGFYDDEMVFDDLIYYLGYLIAIEEFDVCFAFIYLFNSAFKPIFN